jgi:phosphoglycerate dehydrogenase-like enzyme
LDVIFFRPQIAEWVIGSWLMHTHMFLQYAKRQEEAKWLRTNDNIYDSPGLRMGILGYGAIGRHCARLGSALGMEVFAYTRSERLTPESRKDDSFCTPGTGDPDGLVPSKWFHGASRDAVDEFLAQDLDILVISLPLTPETRHIIGPKQFEILSKKKTFVSNIARGGHVDTDALINALETGKIRGAALDVTDPEPLTDGHKLWNAPNVFITPHNSWQTPHIFARCEDMIEMNLTRLNEGRPLMNLTNKKTGY